MSTRADRPLSEDRRRIVDAFAARLVAGGATSVLEVGCGAGRDGLVMAGAGLAYRGCDLSPVAVQTCRDLGLDADEAPATDLPYPEDSFDAAWTMSTLMHLPDEGFAEAVRELRRVVRAGGLVEIGVWGADQDREWTGDPHGRFFLNRSDDSFRRGLSVLGDLEEFDTWAHLGSGGGHYQWARVRVG
ncbi:class I SAM-dependent methyltransferase [Dermacoccaceae bacterium W4C1]